MPILPLAIIYLCIMIIIFIYDIYLLKKAMKMKKKNILHYCVFNIILSNFCHIFYYTINFWKDFYSNDFFVKLCYFQASMINSHPIITDLSNEKLPVYSMFHDDWSSLQQISIDFEQYIEILNKIDEADIGNENEKDKLISYIKAIVPEEGIEYWESLIQVGYEFLNDID